MLIVLNNKCSFKKDEYNNYLNKISKIKTNQNLVICPSDIYLLQSNKEPLMLGSQNVSKYEMGPHTGEISAQQLKSLGVKYTIVGHQERRVELNETKEDIKQKVKKLIKEDIIPIVCVGETNEQRNNDSYIETLLSELDFVINDFSESEKEKIIIAYEPIWCIGTECVPDIEYIYKVVSTIKKYYPNNSVLYGGGINDTNIESLKTIEDLNGYLLGQISLVPEKIQKFINILEN